MVNDDVVKCPLCGGFTHIEKPDVLQALKNPRLREQVEGIVNVAAIAVVDAQDNDTYAHPKVHIWLEPELVGED
jgi:hypothetical protein